MSLTSLIQNSVLNAGMVLTYDAYNETLEKQQEKESEIQKMQQKYEHDMKTMREEMQSKFQQILTKIDTGKLG